MKREKNKWRDAGQEAHDEWLRKQSDEDLRRLARGLNGLMISRLGSVRSFLDTSTGLTPSDELGAVARAATRHPSLTSEEATEIAEAFGF
jgi:hypothetical protein